MVYKRVGKQIFFWEDDTYKVEGTYKDDLAAIAKLSILRGEVVPLGTSAPEPSGQSGTLSTETPQERPRAIVRKRRTTTKKK